MPPRLKDNIERTNSKQILAMKLIAAPKDHRQELQKILRLAQAVADCSASEERGAKTGKRGEMAR